MKNKIKVKDICRLIDNWTDRKLIIVNEKVDIMSINEITRLDIWVANKEVKAFDATDKMVIVKV